MKWRLNCYAIKTKKSYSSLGLCPHAPSVIRLSCIILFRTGYKLDNFAQKNILLVQAPLSKQNPDSASCRIHCCRQIFQAIIWQRGGVEDTRLEVKAKDTHKKKIRAKAKDSPSEDRPFRVQRPRTQAQVSSKKKVFKIFFRSSPKKVIKKNFQAFSKKQGLQNFFQANYKILTIQEILLSSSQEQGNFRGLDSSRPSTLK